MSDEKEQAATGALIQINGQLLPVHCDCREVRDALEAYFRWKAIDFVDAMLRDKQITKERHEEQLQQTFKEGRRGEYAYGSAAFATARISTDYGIKYDRFARLKIKNAKLTLEQVSAWVDEHGWPQANQLMLEADGHAPKSDTPEAGQPSSGVSSKSSTGQ